MNCCLCQAATKECALETETDVQDAILALVVQTADTLVAKHSVQDYVYLLMSLCACWQGICLVLGSFGVAVPH